MNWIILTILLLSCLDLFFTFKYVDTFREKFPDKDYKQLEANPIIRKMWDMFGFGKGMLISVPIILLGWSLFCFVAPDNIKYFGSGMLTMMMAYHYLNWAQLRVL